MYDISLAELKTLVVLQELETIRATASSLRTTPGNVSKILYKLEQKLGMQLLWRTTTGTTLTPEGKRVTEYARKMLALGEDIRDLGGGEKSLSQFDAVLNLGSNVSLNNTIISIVVGRLTKVLPRLRFQLLDLAPDAIFSAAMSGNLEAALYIGAIEWPRTWSVAKVGDLRWGLVSRSGHPLGTQTTEEKIKHYPFVMPTYWQNKQFVPGVDYCPLPAASRIVGFGVANAQAAASIVQHSDHLAFLPLSLLVDPSSRSNLISGLQEVSVQGWAPVHRAIYLAVKSDRMSMRVKKVLLHSLSEEFLELNRLF